MRKETITRAEYLQLLGLSLMASQHDQKMRDIRDSIYELLGTSEDDDKHSHVSDLLWGGDYMNVDRLLKGLNIRLEVEKQEVATDGD
jgi:hypothetical protein